MIDAFLAKIFGTKNEREVKAMLPTVAAINAREPEMRQLSDIDLAAKTIEFREKLGQGATLDDLLTEAFAVVREAGRRILNMRHFDVQFDRMVLHQVRMVGPLVQIARPAHGRVYSAHDRAVLRKRYSTRALVTELLGQYRPVRGSRVRSCPGSRETDQKRA